MLNDRLARGYPARGPAARTRPLLTGLARRQATFCELKSGGGGTKVPSPRTQLGIRSFFIKLTPELVGG